MLPFRFNIIGAGALGTQLTLALCQHGHTLNQVVSRTASHANRLIHRAKQGIQADNIQAFTDADITFITTPDDAIADVVQALNQRPPQHSAHIIVHLSGVYASDILTPLKSATCHIASLHPMKAFKIADEPDFKGCLMTLEGDVTAVDTLNTHFSALGAKIVPIETTHKARYHAACCIASNYLVTLAHLAKNLMQTSGMDEATAKAAVINLMQASLTNLETAPSFPEALTGPIARGDVQTIQLHLEALKNHPTKAIYKDLGLHSLMMFI